MPMTALTGIVSAVLLGIVFHIIDRSRDKEEEKDQKGEHTVVRFPKAYFWVGVVCTLVFTGFILLASFYNSETSGTWVYIVFTAFAVLGVVLSVATSMWRIDLFKNEDYFLYKKAFGRTHNVLYKECLGYRFSTITRSVVVRTENKKIAVNVEQVNFEMFMSMLARHGVKEEK